MIVNWPELTTCYASSKNNKIEVLKLINILFLMGIEEDEK